MFVFTSKYDKSYLKWLVDESARTSGRTEVARNVGPRSTRVEAEVCVICNLSVNSLNRYQFGCSPCSVSSFHREARLLQRTDDFCITSATFSRRTCSPPSTGLCGAGVRAERMYIVQARNLCRRDPSASVSLLQQKQKKAENTLKIHHQLFTPTTTPPGPAQTLDLQLLPDWLRRGAAVTSALQKSPSE